VVASKTFTINLIRKKNRLICFLFFLILILKELAINQRASSKRSKDHWKDPGKESQQQVYRSCSQTMESRESPQELAKTDTWVSTHMHSTAHVNSMYELEVKLRGLHF
jgi:hypothetical protein